MQTQYAKRILPHQVGLFSALCWATYFFTYFGRYSFVSGMGALVADGSFSKAGAGLVASLFYLAYSASQLLCGLVGDRLPPRILVFVGVFGSGVCNLLFVASPSAGLRTGIWVLNGVLQGLVWPPLIRMCAMLLEGNQCVKVSVNVTSSSPVSMVVVYLLSALGIRLFSWRALFWLSAVAMAAMAFVWLFAAGRLERASRLVELPRAVEGQSEANAPNGLWQLGAAAGLLALLGACLVNGTLKDGIFTWVPTYLMENFGLTAQTATLLATLLPLVNLAGVYLAKYVNCRWLRNEAATSTLFFLATLASLLPLAAGQGGVRLSVWMFAVSTSLMMGANAALVSLIPLHFSRCNRVAAVTGLLNTAVHLGGGVSGYLFGLLSEWNGWQFIRIAWCALALLGALACLLAVKRWSRFRDPAIR